METKIIKVANEGQISIPAEIRNAIGLSVGDDLIAVSDGETIYLKKIKKDDFRDLVKHSEIVAEKLWSNEEDEIWDTV